ncbi:MAG: hypothetical protein ACJAX5_002448 [Patiriisocius sp.]|jgi:hypothetical protein
MREKKLSEPLTVNVEIDTRTDSFVGYILVAVQSLAAYRCRHHTRMCSLPRSTPLPGFVAIGTGRIVLIAVD